MTRQEAVDFLNRIATEHATDRQNYPGPVFPDLGTQARTALHLLADIPDWAIDPKSVFHVSVQQPDDGSGLSFPHLQFFWSRSFNSMNPGNSITYINMTGDTCFAVRSSQLREVFNLPPPIVGRPEFCGLALGPSAKEQLDKILSLQVFGRLGGPG